jgi:hypothetical protein
MGFNFIQFNRRITALLVKRLSTFFEPIDDYELFFKNIITSQRFRRVVEIGGASRPLFDKCELDSYTGVDIDSSFCWSKIYTHYYNQSCEERLPDHVKGDLVVSKYVLEHVFDNKKTFLNLKRLTAQGGVSVHLLPLGFHPFSLANRLIGNHVARKLIPILRPGTETITGYPAFYHLCNCVQLERSLRELDLKFKVKYFYGAEDYFGFFAPLGISIHIFNRVCSLLRLKIFASNAVLVIWQDIGSAENNSSNGDVVLG